MQMWRGQPQPIPTSDECHLTQQDTPSALVWLVGLMQLVCDSSKVPACLRIGNALAATAMLVTELTAAPLPVCTLETAQVKACLLQ